MAWLLKCLRGRCFLGICVIMYGLLGNAVQAKEFQKKKIKLGAKTLIVEVAQTQEQLAFGLMFREKLNPDEGMLFIFADEAVRSFWMKNTLIDLSIGFFDGKRRLVDVKEMKSGKGIIDQALPSYVSAHPARYALEMNKGWFEKNKIRIGDTFKFE